MLKEDVVRAYGLGAQAMTMLARLAHQIKDQGGEEEDVRLLENDQVMEKIASILVKEGALRRGKFDVIVNGNVIEISVLGLDDTVTFGALLKIVEEFGCRLADFDEMLALDREVPELLSGDDKVVIGNRIKTIGESHFHWTLKTGGRISQENYPSDGHVENCHLFVLVFC